MNAGEESEGRKKKPQTQRPKTLQASDLQVGGCHSDHFLSVHTLFSSPLTGAQWIVHLLGFHLHPICGEATEVLSCYQSASCATRREVRHERIGSQVLYCAPYDSCTPGERSIAPEKENFVTR